MVKQRLAGIFFLLVTILILFEGREGEFLVCAIPLSITLLFSRKTILY